MHEFYQTAIFCKKQNKIKDENSNCSDEEIDQEELINRRISMREMKRGLYKGAATPATYAPI